MASNATRGQWGLLIAWGAREGVQSALPFRGSILNRAGGGEVWGQRPGRGDLGAAGRRGVTTGRS